MDLLDLAMGILGGLITLALGIIGYFLKRQIAVIDVLNNSINALTRTVAVLENKSENSFLNCGYKHNIIDARLNSHAKSIDILEKDVAVLKSKCS